MNNIIKLSEYRDWLHDLKQQIKKGQIRAAISVNSQMIMLYWELGRQIAEKQDKTKWGSGFIEQLSRDLREEFPEMMGFSLRNLRFVKQWYLFYSQDDLSKVKQLVSQLPQVLNSPIAEQIQTIDDQYSIIWKQVVSKLVLIPWGHHIKIMQKVKDVKQALFYINKTVENNWSRSVLEYQIEIDFYGRLGKAITNFNLTLPAPQSDLANEYFPLYRTG